MPRQKALGFGFIPQESEHHFLVLISRKRNGQVSVYERFQWDEENERQPVKEKNRKVTISKEKWNLLKEPLRKEFNKRLKEMNITVGRWTGVEVPVERLLGKEMVLLLWAIEDCDISVINEAIQNWYGLTKEERWWLFTMTNASTGYAPDKRGWRKAIRYALTENPVMERAPQRSIIEEIFNQQTNSDGKGES